MANNNTAAVPEKVQKPVFQKTTTTEELDRKLTKLENSVAKLTEAFNTENLNAQREAVAENEEALKDYNAYATRVAYEEFLSTDIPMKSALKAGYITLKKVVCEEDLGVKNYKTDTVKKQIDFVSFNSYCRTMSAKVSPFASQMGYIVFLSKGIGDGKNAADLTKVYQSARGRVITEVLKSAPSMNKKKEALQNLIDAIYFEDCGTGKNRFMVTKEWVNWFQDHICKTGYTEGSLYRQSKTPKEVLQTACALYHAFFNKYGIDSVGDRDHVLKGSTNESLNGKEKSTTAKKSVAKAAKVA